MTAITVDTKETVIKMERQDRQEFMLLLSFLKDSCCLEVKQMAVNILTGVDCFKLGTQIGAHRAECKI